MVVSIDMLFSFIDINLRHNYKRGIKMESETVLQLHPRFGVLTIHGKLAFVGMEIVVAGGEFYIVVERIGGGKAVEDAAVCHVDVGKGGEFQRVVQQFL